MTRPILCLGKNGQVASALAEIAQRDGVSVQFAGRDEVDLMQVGAAAAYIRGIAPGIIINTAAFTAVDKAETEVAAARRLNQEAVEEIAIAARATQSRLIHISTDYVFDGDKVGCYRETDATAPQSVYGRTKLAGEQAILATLPNALIVRTSWIYSGFGSNFVKTMVRLAKDRNVIRVVDDQVGCPTFAGDLAVALLRLAQAPEHGGLYHLAGCGKTSWAGFARAIFDETAKCGGPSSQVEAITTADYPTPAQRPFNSCLDSSAIAQDYGIVLPPWRESVARCVRQLGKMDWKWA